MKALTSALFAILLLVSPAAADGINNPAAGAAPSGAAGGGLTGTYPNPTVATVPASALPVPTASTLGGVMSLTASASNWLRSIGTDGIPTKSQPAFTDISGSVAASQMPALTGDVTTSAGAVATAIGATKVTSSMLNADVFSTAHSWAGQQTFVAPILGTPASGVATNLTGTAAGLTAGNVTVSRAIVGSGSGAAVANATTYFMGMQGPSTSATGLAIALPVAATLKNFQCLVGFALTAGQTVTCTVRTGGNGSPSASALTCQITNGQTLCTDLVHSVAVPATNVYDITMVTAGGVSGTGIGWGLEVDN